jgi:hypothetical protein
MNLKCMISLRPGGNKSIPGILTGYAPSPTVTEEEIAAGSKDKLKFTMDGLVLLASFDRGSVYQIPLNQIKVTGEWWDGEDDTRMKSIDWARVSESNPDNPHVRGKSLGGIVFRTTSFTDYSACTGVVRLEMMTEHGWKEVNDWYIAVDKASRNASKRLDELTGEAIEKLKDVAEELS